MRIHAIKIFALCLSIALAGLVHADNVSGGAAVPKNFQIPFLENRGEIADPNIKYYAQTLMATVYVLNDGQIRYALHGGAAEDQFVEHIHVVQGSLPRGKKVAKALINDLRGKNQARWKRGVVSWETIELGMVCDGISVELKADKNNVEKLFYVQPGADPAKINVSMGDEDTRLTVAANGELVMTTMRGDVRFSAPVAYQNIGEEKQPVDVAYTTSENTYGFSVGEYDTTHSLVIDPLLASTYLGGTNADFPEAIAVATNGDIYVAGITRSIDFPTTSGAYDETFDVLVYTNIDGDVSQQFDVFVARLDNDLTTLLSATFIGGDDNESLYDIALDASGNVYLYGSTTSSNYPVTPGAYSTNIQGAPYFDNYLENRDVYNPDLFISKFNADLSILMASTYLGGDDFETASEMAIDASGNIYVVGTLFSTNFPTTAASYMPNYVGGYDGFIAKLDPGLSNLLASTYLGGDDTDIPYALAIDADTNVYVVGTTSSTNFPVTSGAFDESLSDANGDGFFIAKLSDDLTQLQASTFLGGTDEDISTDVALGQQGSVFVAGVTESIDFPTTAGAFRTNLVGFGGSDDALVVSKLDKNLTNLLASTYIGSGGNAGMDAYLSLTSNDTVYIAGWVEYGMDGYITSCIAYTEGSYVSPLASTSDSEHVSGAGSYIVRMDAGLSNLLTCASTGLGSFDDMALDTLGQIYIVGIESAYGEVDAKRLPTTSSSYQSELSGLDNFDSFVVRFDKTATIQPELSVSSSSTGTVIQFSSATNVSYVLQKSTNLLSGFTDVVEAQIVGTPPYNTRVDTNGSGTASAFYRISLE